MNIIPLCRPCFEEQPETLVTPCQWITPHMMGDVRMDYGESNVPSLRTN
ncbi:MAG: hypothetical protein ACLRU1_07400 [Veillonella parvula]